MVAGLSIILLLSIVPSLRSQSSVGNQTSPRVEWLWSLSVSCLNDTYCSPPPAGPGLSTHYGIGIFYADHTATINEVYTIYNSTGQVTWRDTEIDQIDYWKISPMNDFIYVKGTNTTTIFTNGIDYTTLQPFNDYNSGFTATAGSLNCVQFIQGLGGSPPYFCPEDLSIQITMQEVS